MYPNEQGFGGKREIFVSFRMVGNNRKYEKRLKLSLNYAKQTNYIIHYILG